MNVGSMVYKCQDSMFFMRFVLYKSNVVVYTKK